MVFNSCVVVAIQVDLLMWKWMYHTIAWKTNNGRLLERKKRGIPLCWLILKNGLSFIRLFLFPKRQFLYKSNAFSSADRTLYSHIVLLKDHLHLLTHWWCSTLRNDMSLYTKEIYHIQNIQSVITSSQLIQKPLTLSYAYI